MDILNEAERQMKICIKLRYLKGLNLFDNIFNYYLITIEFNLVFHHEDLKVQVIVDRSEVMLYFFVNVFHIFLITFPSIFLTDLKSISSLDKS